MSSTKNMEDDRTTSSEDLDRSVYTCNSCSKSIESRYHCLKCDDFDLCIPCYEKEGHPHRMQKMIRNHEIPENQNEESRRFAILAKICIQTLVHTCQCKDTDCKLPSCHKM